MKRSECCDKYKWDLTKIFENDIVFYKELEDFTNEMNSITKYKNNILKSSSNLLEFIETSNNLDRKIEKLYTYAHLNIDSETSNSKYQEMMQKVEDVYKNYLSLTSFILPEMLKEDYSLVEGYIKENKLLEKYAYNLEVIYREKGHQLDEATSYLLSRFSGVLGSGASLFETLTDTDMKFGVIKVDSKEVELNESNYSIYVSSNNRDTRRNAWTRLHEVYGSYKNTLTSTYNKYMEYMVTLAEITNYKSALCASLASDNVKEEVYLNLIDEINNNLDVLHKYYKLEKEVLKLDEMHIYDTYAKMGKDLEIEYDYDKAKELVVKAMSVLGDDYVEDLKQAFTCRWIDVYHNDSKRGGAYSSGMYDTYPYILLNYENRLRDVSTLAHELGHSMHSYYSHKYNDYNNSSYKIFVAEVASTVNELLLAKYMIKNSTNKKEKKYILNELLDLFKSTIYRQTMFAEFEYNTHKLKEDGIPITNELLSNMYLDLNKKYFGHDVVVDDLIKYEYLRIPHFYYNFYVYKYAIGLSSACKIVNDILSGKDGAREKYRKFLTLGGSQDPVDELMVAGVDVLDKNLYKDAIEMFSSLIDEYRRIDENE